jgi:hypothetical protein
MFIAALMMRRSSSVESCRMIGALCRMHGGCAGVEARRNRRCGGRGDAAEAIMMRRSSSAYGNHRTSVADDCGVAAMNPMLIMTMIGEAEGAQKHVARRVQ